MNKASPSSEWENIQGFDRTKGEYIRLDGDAWLADHHIREEGKKRGERDRPGPDEKLPDEMYNKIQNWVQKRALDCKEEVSKYIQDKLHLLHDLHSHWENENPKIVLDTRVKQRCQDLQSKTDQSVSDLDEKRAEFKEAALDLKSFRQKHQLSRVADYPSSKPAHWLWVIALAIIETFVGANLLGSVSRGGVIEGWMVAGILTAGNIVLGIGAGQVWRFIHHGLGLVKLLACTLGIIFTIASLFWNVLAGHFRDVYVLAEKTSKLETVDTAFATAWGKMFESPLPWESLPSAALALVGIFVFAMTAYKSYTADDPFPGYGAKHRKTQKLRESYQKYLNNSLAELKSVHDEAIVEINEIKSRYEIDRATWESTHDKLRAVDNQYPMNLRQYNKDLIYLLAAYRDANLAARTVEPPPFFNIEPTIDEDALQPVKFELPNPPEWSDIPAKAGTSSERVRKTYAELRTRYQMLDSVDDYRTEDAT